MSNRGMFDVLRQRGEEVFTQVSNELMMNPRFLKAMQTAMKGKETVDFAVTEALKTMNVPTRTEFKRAMSRVESVENELRELRDELRRTRAQAARASVAARTATRGGTASAETAPKPARKKKAASRKTAAGATRARKSAPRRAKSKKAAAPATPVTVDGAGIPTE